MKVKKKKSQCVITWCIDRKTGAVRLSLDGKCDKREVMKFNLAVQNVGVVLPRIQED